METYDSYLALFIASGYDRTGAVLPAVVAGVMWRVNDTSLLALFITVYVATIVGEIAYYTLGRSAVSVARFRDIGRRAIRVAVGLLPGRLSTWIRSVAGRLVPTVLTSASSTPAMIFGRFLPIVGRAPSPLLGLARANIRTFVALTSVGQFLLVTTYFGVGVVGASFLSAERVLSADLAITLAAASILPFAIALVYFACTRLLARRS